ncbi:hypothetical protein [Streptomyces sp. NPDC094472]
MAIRPEGKQDQQIRNLATEVALVAREAISGRRPGAPQIHIGHATIQILG